jgi:prepilin signal peptidase PulO-like enzyme (type II secretory pathway)
MTITLFYILIALLGLVFGSFINVVALRDHKRKTIVTGRSFCPHCKHTLAWHDLIPLVSFVVLGGKCRYCKKPISIRYPLVELTMSALAVFAGWYGFIQRDSLVLVAFLALCLGMFLVLSLIDLGSMEVPVEYVAVAGILGSIAVVASHVLTFVASLEGALLGGGAIAAVVYGWRFAFHQDGMGEGDIWIAAAIGAVVGAPMVLVSLMIAVFTGAIVGIGMLGVSKGSMKTAIPFGPFLFIGLLGSLIWGQTVLSWYIL